jgi:hypothetical protein
VLRPVADLDDASSESSISGLSTKRLTSTLNDISTIKLQFFF